MGTTEAQMADRIIQQVLDINHQVTLWRAEAERVELALYALGVTELPELPTDEEDKRFEAEQEDKWGKGWHIRKGIDSDGFLTGDDWQDSTAQTSSAKKGEASRTERDIMIRSGR